MLIPTHIPHLLNFGNTQIISIMQMLSVNRAEGGGPGARGNSILRLGICLSLRERKRRYGKKNYSTVGYSHGKLDFGMISMVSRIVYKYLNWRFIKFYNFRHSRVSKALIPCLAFTPPSYR